MMISMNELKWMASRAHNLYGDGILAFYGHEDMPTVHLNKETFHNLFACREVKKEDFSRDTVKLIYFEDGVRFFCLADKEVSYDY